MPGVLKGASGVAGDDAARHPCPARGTRGAKRVPDEEIPQSPRGEYLAGCARTRRHLGSAAGQMSGKTEAENDQPAVLSGDGTVEDNGHPDQSIWGESSLHQTRGVPQRDCAFTDGLYGTGLRLSEWASVLLCELPPDDPSRGYYSCTLADGCAKGGRGRRYWMPRTCWPVRWQTAPGTGRQRGAGRSALAAMNSWPACGC